jgi:hypothetical protein
MGIVKWFSGFLGTNKASSSNVSAAQSIVSNMSGYITDLSQWEKMNDADIYEQMYVWEAVVGGAIDRISTLVKQSVSGCIVKDIGEALDPSEIAMRAEANALMDELEIRDLFESIAEILLIHGNVFLLENDDKSLTILPNKYCSFIEDTSQAGNSNVEKIIMQPNYLAFNEKEDSELEIITYPAEKITHIKYKNTPIFMKDEMGRNTFGMYAVSPLHRSVLLVWWKRQLMILDVLFRWRMVPREHHKIDSEIFSLAGRQGSQAERLSAAQADAELYISNYIKNLKQQMPDQGYVTTDSVDIDTIQMQRGTSYTDSNPLMAQLDTMITAGINVPMSMINGSNAGSFASELVISNYVSSKVIQIANKIKPVILKNLRARLPSSYPLEQLDIKIELTLANSQIELYRTMTIMAAMGIFTDTEIREMGGWNALTDEQREYIVNTSTRSRANIVSDVTQGGSNVTPDYPETSKSTEKHNRDAFDNVLRDD